MKKVIYKNYDIEITLREFLVSIAILIFMFGFGYYIYENLDNSDNIKQYQSAQIVDNDKNKIDYLINTKFGNALIYSTFITNENDSVTFDEIDGKYSFIKRVKQEYIMHSRNVCETDSDGNELCHIEYYWTWDDVKTDRKYAKKLYFLGYEFEGEKLLNQINNTYLQLSKKIYKNKYRNINARYVYTKPDVRFYYEYIPLQIKGSIFSNLRNDKWNNEYTLFKDMKPNEVIEYIENTRSYLKIVFAIIWIILTVVAIYCFVSLDNKYLEN